MLNHLNWRLPKIKEKSTVKLKQRNTEERFPYLQCNFFFFKSMKFLLYKLIYINDEVYSAALT